LVAIALTMALALFILAAFTLILIAPALASRIAAWFGLAPTVTLVWRIVRWP
jgi:hypothetical protein